GDPVANELIGVMFVELDLLQQLFSAGNLVLPARRRRKTNLLVGQLLQSWVLEIAHRRHSLVIVSNCPLTTYDPWRPSAGSLFRAIFCRCGRWLLRKALPPIN